MAWITLNRQHVLTSLSKPELDAYEIAAIEVGQNVLNETVATVVQEARAHIADCPSNKLASGQTIPERVVHHLVAIVRYRLLSRLDLCVSDPREREYNDARRFLERISECKVAIEKPAGATEDSGSQSNIDLISTSTRIATRSNLSGL